MSLVSDQLITHHPLCLVTFCRTAENSFLMVNGRELCMLHIPAFTLIMSICNCINPYFTGNHVINITQYDLYSFCHDGLLNGLPLSAAQGTSAYCVPCFHTVPAQTESSPSLYAVCPCMSLSFYFSFFLFSLFSLYYASL